MPIELFYLSACVALFFVYLLGEVVTGNLQYKPNELLGSRDNLAENNPALGRAKRATSNMIEAMIMFAPLILIAALTDRFNDWTATGAAVFFFARAFYAPTYWLGVPILRSLLWGIGLVATIIVFLQVIPFSGAA